LTTQIIGSTPIERHGNMAVIPVYRTMNQKLARSERNNSAHSTT
jgi:hypothetical protein